jgi:hypothetical protein
MSEFWICRDPTQLKDRLAFFEQWLREQWDWSRPVEWRAKPYVGRRSLSQNALFHIWCREMAEHFTAKGVDINEEKAKDLLKYRFLGTHDIIVGNTTIPNQLKSTSKLDRGEMFDFMNQVQVWLLDHGVNVTCPDDSEYMQILGGEDESRAIRRNS